MAKAKAAKKGKYTHTKITSSLSPLIQRMKSPGSQPVGLVA